MSIDPDSPLGMALQTLKDVDKFNAKEFVNAIHFCTQAGATSYQIEKIVKDSL